MELRNWEGSSGGVLNVIPEESSVISGKGILLFTKLDDILLTYLSFARLLVAAHAKHWCIYTKKTLSNHCASDWGFMAVISILCFFRSPVDGLGGCEWCWQAKSSQAMKCCWHI